MKAIQLKYLPIILLALVLAAVLYSTGQLNPEALTGLGLIPLAVGDTDFGDLAKMLQKQGTALEEFKSRYDARFKTLEAEMTEVAKKSGRPPVGYGGAVDGKFSAEDVEHKGAFLGYCRTGREIELDRKGMSMGADPDGGYLVPKQIDSEISKVLREASPIRQIARVIKVESEDFSMVHSVGGTESAWVGETSARPGTASPQFRLITPAFGELYANPMLTQRLLDDNAFDLENWLIEELVEAFAAGEGAAFMTGDGVNKPRGLLTYDTASTADGVRGESAMQYVASGASGAFAASNPHDKLMTLVHAVKPRYRGGSSWLMNTNTLEALRTIKNGSGDYIFRAGLELGQPDTLLGYPLFEDENMPDISAGSLSIAFGNFLRGYVVADRNTSLLRDPFSAKPYVGFYTTQRVGACVRDFRAIKFMKFSAS